MYYSCVFKILWIKQVMSWWWCCASHLSLVAVGSRSDAYKPSFSIFAKRCPHLFPIYKQLLVSHNQPYLLPTTSRRPWKNLAWWPLLEPSTPNLGVPCNARASTHGKLCRTGLVVSRLALQPWWQWLQMVRLTMLCWTQRQHSCVISSAGSCHFTMRSNLTNR